MFQETNKAADWLAKKHSSGNFVIVSPDSFDSDMKKFLEEDSSRKVYYRS